MVVKTYNQTRSYRGGVHSVKWGARDEDGEKKKTDSRKEKSEET